MKQRNPSKKIWELNIHQTSGTSPKVNPTNVFTHSFNKHWSHVHFLLDPRMMVGTQKYMQDLCPHGIPSLVLVTENYNREW